MDVREDLEVRELLPELRRTGANGEICRARDSSLPPLLPRKRVPWTPKEWRRGGSDSAPGALSPAPRPPVCKPVGCPGVELGALGRSQTSSPAAPSRPHAGPRGEAHGHRLRRVNSCLITFCVAPLFVFYCARKRENFRIKAEKAHLFPMNPP